MLPAGAYVVELMQKPVLKTAVLVLRLLASLRPTVCPITFHDLSALLSVDCEKSQGTDRCVTQEPTQQRDGAEDGRVGDEREAAAAGRLRK